MTNAILRGKPDAGNPHVRFDEGEVAPAKPRRGSLLYKKLMMMFAAAMVALGVLAGGETAFQQFWREMALGSGRLDLGVKFRGATYAVEVKTTALYQKSLEAAHEQMCRYMDQLGVPEGWLVVADSDLSKPWDGKISTTDIPANGKTIHLVRC